MRRTTQLLVGIVLLSGCLGEQIPTETTHMRQEGVPSEPPTTPVAATQVGTIPPAASPVLGADVNRDLAALRRVTAPFQRFKNATEAGWSVQITPCMTDPAGGMGFHYGNPAIIDGTVHVEDPELLLYEPQQNGRLRLVAVEYIIPYTARSRDATPPVLFGQEFQRNDVFQLWGLHAWIWKHNPSGMFANWNPEVTCEHANSVSTMKH